MKAFEIVVPYLVSQTPHQLTLRIVASGLAEAKRIARTRALFVRPLLGGDRVSFPGGLPSPDLAPNRAA